MLGYILVGKNELARDAMSLKQTLYIFFRHLGDYYGGFFYRLKLPYVFAFILAATTVWGLGDNTGPSMAEAGAIFIWYFIYQFLIGLVLSITQTIMGAGLKGPGRRER